MPSSATGWFPSVYALAFWPPARRTRRLDRAIARHTGLCCAADPLFSPFGRLVEAARILNVLALIGRPVEIADVFDVVSAAARQRQSRASSQASQCPFKLLYSGNPDARNASSIRNLASALRTGNT